jgi:DNA polymerase III delta subunit
MKKILTGDPALIKDYLINKLNFNQDNLTYYYCEDQDFSADDFNLITGSLSIFEDTVYMLCYTTFKAIDNFVFEYLVSDRDTATIIVMVDKKDRSSEYTKLKNLVTEFTPLSENELYRFCNRYTKKVYNLEISKEFVLRIKEKTGYGIVSTTGVYDIINTIKILASVSKSKNNMIEGRALNEVEDCFCENVFDYTTAVCEKNNGKALRVLENILANNVSSELIISNLLRNFRILYKILIGNKVNIGISAYQYSIYKKYRFDYSSLDYIIKTIIETKKNLYLCVDKRSLLVSLTQKICNAQK